MHIALIGMSAVGKSYWSQCLQRVGFACFDCDGMIRQKLSLELANPLESLADLTAWMGRPTDGEYELRASRYLAQERTTLAEIVSALAPGQGLDDTDVVVDTTGSSVYAPPAIWSRFRQRAKIVHLATTPKVQAEMLSRFRADPRPLIWNELFEFRPGETLDDAYARCYPALLQQREGLYARYRDVGIDYHEHRRPNLTPERFLQLVGS